ncbi:hypothetical protein BC830DRAFT_1118582 [Chytriomyces sp. MP71]|nr:hypothetical protein BC830DRAFT_1118582 [Chytriomyces sp. MP71]
MSDLLQAICINARQRAGDVAIRHVDFDGIPSWSQKHVHPSLLPCKKGVVSEWTFAQVWAGATRWAEELTRQAAENPSSNATRSRKRIVTVAVAVADGPFLPFLHLACLLACRSITLVPIDASDPRLPLLLEDADPVLFVVSDEAQALVVSAAAAKVDRIDLSRVKAILLSDLTLTDCSNASELDLSSFSGSEISHVYFTSGSTGRPKGCIVSLSSLASYCLRAKPQAHVITSESVVFIASSHTFDPSLGDHISALASGCILARAPRANVITSLQACLDAVYATHTCTNPSLFDTVLSRPCSLKVVALGGEVMSAAVVERCREWGVSLINTYGVTECAVYQMVFHVPAGSREGRKWMGVQGMGECEIFLMRSKVKTADVNLADLDPILDMEPVDGKLDGEMGEIWIGGPQVGVGYLSRHALTTQRFISHPTFGNIFRTGDLAQVQVCSHLAYAFDFSARGKLPPSSRPAALVFVGRSDTQIKINGMRVEVEEVEQALLTRAGQLVREVAVVLNKHARVLVAYFVPVDIDTFLVKNEGHVTSERAAAVRILREVLFRVSDEALPAHMVPAKFVLLEALPLSTAGKIARSDLAGRDVFYDPFETDEEDGAYQLSEALVVWVTFVKDVWRRVLGLSEVHVVSLRTRFSELGGDSLKALAVCKQINEKLDAADMRPFVHAAAADDEDDMVNDKNRHSKPTDTDVGGFGELLGVLAPAELMKRPQLLEFARYLSESYSADFDSSLLTGCDSRTQAPLNLSKPSTPTRPVESKHGVIQPERDSFLGHFEQLLYLASANNLAQIVSYLLKQMRISPNPPYQVRTTTPLHIACMNSCTAAVEVLIAHGAVASAPDNSGVTPFHFACQRGPFSLVKLLLPPPADAKPTGKKGAAKGKPNPLVFQLDGNGQTAFHHACRAGAPNAVIEYLTVVGVDAPRLVEAKDSWGRTGLHWAVVNGHGDAVKVLIRLGADVRVKDAAGEDAVDIAERRARCGEAARGGGVRASVFGDIAKVLGGSGSTKNVSRFLSK